MCRIWVEVRPNTSGTGHQRPRRAWARAPNGARQTVVTRWAIGQRDATRGTAGRRGNSENSGGPDGTAADQSAMAVGISGYFGHLSRAPSTCRNGVRGSSHGTRDAFTRVRRRGDPGRLPSVDGVLRVLYATYAARKTRSGVRDYATRVLARQVGVGQPRMPVSIAAYKRR